MSDNISGKVFVGRKEELEKIQQAIEAPGFQIVNIQGEGGIGKTSLLTAVLEGHRDRQDLYVTEILDFFSTTTHTRGGFLAMLIDEFPDGAFEDYREEREKHDVVRLAGMPGRGCLAQAGGSRIRYRMWTVRLVLS